MLGDEAPEGLEEAWSIYAPLRDADLELDRLAVGSVFTTMDAVSGMFALRDFIDEYDVPELVSMARSSSFPGLYVEYVGTYLAPNFQSGEPPFLREGGFLEYDADGKPVVQRTEELRFSITIPSLVEEPEKGWPVVMYGHGTGGNYRSYIDSGAAASLARVGIATIGIDQVHHGTRDTRPDNCAQQSDPGACVSALFFNFLNPLAGRDNVRQSAADFVSLARMLRSRALIESSTPAPVTDTATSDTDMDSEAVDAGMESEADAGIQPEADDNGMESEPDAGVQPEADDVGMQPEADGGIETEVEDAGIDAEVADAGVDAESIDAGMASDVGGSMDQKRPSNFGSIPTFMYLGIPRVVLVVPCSLPSTVM